MLEKEAGQSTKKREKKRVHNLKDGDAAGKQYVTRDDGKRDNQ